MLASVTSACFASAPALKILDSFDQRENACLAVDLNQCRKAQPYPDLAILQAGMNVKISNCAARQEQFYESESVAWIDPDVDIERSSANHLDAVPATYAFERTVYFDIAVVYGSG
jgi:hypothetical protein